MASSSSPSNPPLPLPLPLPMKDGQIRNWAELPPEITSSILLRLSVEEILRDAQRVCTSWRRVCKDPLMWRKIDMRNLGIGSYVPQEACCRSAVDMSQGGLLEIDIEFFGTDSLITYIAQSSSNLRRLGLSDCYHLTSFGISEAIVNLPFLEELKLSYCSVEEHHLELIGESCPNLKKLNLKYVNYTYTSYRVECDDDALAIAKTMPGLRHLQLLANRLSNTGLNAILDSCPHLEHLDLRRCPYINLVGDLEKRCLERIKVVRHPSEYSTARYILYDMLSDNGSDGDFSFDDYDAYGCGESVGESIDSEEGGYRGVYIDDCWRI